MNQVASVSQTSWPMAAVSRNWYFSRRREQPGRVGRALLQPLTFHFSSTCSGLGQGVKWGNKLFRQVFIYLYVYKSLKPKCPFLLTVSLDFDWSRHCHGLSRQGWPPTPRWRARLCRRDPRGWQDAPLCHRPHAPRSPERAGQPHCEKKGAMCRYGTSGSGESWRLGGEKFYETCQRDLRQNLNQFLYYMMGRNQLWYSNYKWFWKRGFSPH